MSERELKALVIAAKSKLTKKGDVWHVPSQSGYAPFYEVDPNPESPHCTCPDFEKRQQRCKHIFAVEIVIEREQSITETTDGDTTTTTVTETVKVTRRVTYSQDWTAYNQAQTNEKDLFQKLLHDLCSGIVEPGQPNGRPRLMYKDMIFSAAFKVYSTMSGRRFMSDLREANARGYLSKVSHFNSIFNYLELGCLTPLLRDLITFSSLPLKTVERDFAVDSSGFSTSQYVRWYDEKYGKEMSEHDWVKMHLMCGVKTNIVTSVEISGRHANDGPFLPPLVHATANNFTVKEVSADKAYSTFDNHEAIAQVGGTPYIAFKSNATGAVGGVYQKMYHYYCLNREAFLDSYHKRSNSESTFSMIKAKFGGYLRSKGETAQVNEALCKVLAHNICCLVQSMFEFGIKPDFAPNLQ